MTEETNKGETHTEIRVWTFTPWGIVNEHLTVEVTEEWSVTTDAHGCKCEELVSRACKII